MPGERVERVPVAEEGRLVGGHGVDHRVGQPALGLALELRPRFARVLPIEGNGADILDMETVLQLDLQLVEMFDPNYSALLAGVQRELRAKSGG